MCVTKVDHLKSYEIITLRQNKVTTFLRNTQAAVATKIIMQQENILNRQYFYII